MIYETYSWVTLLQLFAELKILTILFCCMALLVLWLSSVLENVEYGMYVNSNSVVSLRFSIYIILTRNHLF